MSDQGQTEFTTSTLPPDLKGQISAMMGLSERQIHNPWGFHLYKEGMDSDLTATMGFLFQAAIIHNRLEGIPFEEVAELAMHHRDAFDMQRTFDQLVTDNMAKYNAETKSFTVSPQLIEEILSGDYKLNDPGWRLEFGGQDTFQKMLNLRRVMPKANRRNYRKLGGSLSKGEQQQIYEGYLDSGRGVAADYLRERMIDYTLVPTATLLHLETLLRRHLGRKVDWYIKETYAISGYKAPELEALKRKTSFLPSIFEYGEASNDKVYSAYLAITAERPASEIQDTLGRKVLTAIHDLTQAKPDKPLLEIALEAYTRIDHSIPDWLKSTVKDDSGSE